MLPFLSPTKSEANMATPPDTALVQAAQRDTEAFILLYRRYVKRIYRYHYSRTGNSADAEDLTSQTFAEALAALSRYQEQGAFAAWLFAIARRRLTDHYRRQRPQQPLDHAHNLAAAEPSPLSQTVHNDELNQLANLVADLSEDKQELLRLRFAAGLTYAEIGRIVKRSEAATKMAVHRLLQQLEQDWEDDDDRTNN
ncbi:MAG: sigma-70 family RNA polymerase sigma factor [Chloroflexi bacterium]|nr:sigma-70 family RNA polymerase sigma factor [Chloroflexota bacterium]